MADLILYLGITLVGYFFGAKFNNKKAKFFWIGTVQTVAIVVLVLFMGMRMGANREITENIGAIGIYALVMTIFTMVFSILFITITRKIFGIDQKGYMRNHINPPEECEKEQEEVLEEIKTIEKEESKIDKMTFFIIGAVII